MSVIQEPLLTELAKLQHLHLNLLIISSFILGAITSSAISSLVPRALNQS